jgi:hypothetical protein
MADSDHRATRRELGDSVHEICYAQGDSPEELGYFDKIEHFDYDEIDRRLGFEPASEERTVTFSDMTALFCLILEFVLGGESLTLAGARAAALAVYLNPVHNNRFGNNLSEIAREAGCTRACLSKALLNFRDSCGVHISAGKPASARDTYRRVQKYAVAAGVHSGFTRKDAKASRRASKKLGS